MIAPPHPSRLDEIVGGKYRVVRFLAAGGMGVVYEAQHTVVRRRFAVKFLHPHLAERRDILTRFQREAEAAGALESENVAAAVDFGIVADGTPYIVMEYLVGESLAALLERERRLPLGRAADLVLQAARGIQAAHAAGVVHRDLKPRNLFVCRREDGTDLVKVLDFGVAKLQAAEENSIATRTGAVLGTASYMSPEQARGDKVVDHRADVYALGAILYELVSGQRPHPGESQNAILYHISTQAAVPLDSLQPELPAPLVEIAMGALASDPQARPASAEAFALALAPFAKRAVWPEGEPAPARESSSVSPAISSAASFRKPPRRRSLALVAVGAVVVAAALAFAIRATRHAPSPPAHPTGTTTALGPAPAPDGPPGLPRSAPPRDEASPEPAAPVPASLRTPAAAEGTGGRPPGRPSKLGAARPTRARGSQEVPAPSARAGGPKQAPVTFDQQNPYD